MAARLSRRACKTYLQMVHNVQLIGSVSKMPQINNPVIGFSEEDVRCLHHPHDDALVVSIQVGDYTRFWLTTAAWLTSYTT